MGLLGFLFIAGAIVLAAKYALIAAAFIAPLWLLGRWVKAIIAAEERHERELNAIRARADQQHQWVWVGDPRGIYGEEYTTPAV